MKVVHIQLSANLDVGVTTYAFETGKAPDPIAYGFHHALRSRYEFSFSSNSTLIRPTSIVRRGLIKLFGFDLIHAIANAKKINKAHYVWTVTDVEYLGVLFILLLYRNNKTFVICNTVWLFDRFDDLNIFKKMFLRMILRRGQIFTFHSQDQLKSAIKLFPNLDARLLYFGVSDTTFAATSVATSKMRTPIRILAAGYDRTRDWMTFFEAFGSDSRFQVELVCNRFKDSDLLKYNNITLRRSPSMYDFKALYDWADLVVIPMVENSYSGITVALEAVASGKPVICSRTGGVPTYFDEGEVFYVSPRDPEELRNKAMSLSLSDRTEYASRALARFLRENYHCSGMVQRYLDLTDSA